MYVHAVGKKSVSDVINIHSVRIGCLERSRVFVIVLPIDLAATNQKYTETRTQVKGLLIHILLRVSLLDLHPAVRPGLLSELTLDTSRRCSNQTQRALHIG